MKNKTEVALEDLRADDRGISWIEILESRIVPGQLPISFEANHGETHPGHERGHGHTEHGNGHGYGHENHNHVPPPPPPPPLDPPPGL